MAFGNASAKKAKESLEGIWRTQPAVARAVEMLIDLISEAEEAEETDALLKQTQEQAAHCDLHLAQTPHHVAMPVGEEAADVIPVTITLQGHGREKLSNHKARGYEVHWRLLSDVDGTPEVAAPDGGVAIAGGGKGMIWNNTGGLSGTLYASPSGSIDLEFTHAAGAKTVYLAITMLDGTVVISKAITWAA